MPILKPELREAEKRANELFHLLRSRSTMTKEEMCAALGWEYNTNNDRRIREVIALLATQKPVISLSDRKGYKLATTREDAQHAINEIKSRIAELSKRLPPLEKYCEQFEQQRLFD